MIRSYRSKALQRFATQGDASKLSVPNTARIRRILILLDSVRALEEVIMPGLRFHPLKGQEKGRYAVDASANWRITFGWDGEDATDVDLEDYH